MSTPDTGGLQYWLDGQPAEGGVSLPVQPGVGTLKYWIDGQPENYVGPEVTAQPASLLMIID